MPHQSPAQTYEDVDISAAEVPRIAHILDDVALYHEARGRDVGSTGSRPRHDGRGLPAHVGSARNQDPLEPWPVAGGDGVAAVVPGARWVVDRGRGGCAPRSPTRRPCYVFSAAAPHVRAHGLRREPRGVAVEPSHAQHPRGARVAGSGSFMAGSRPWQR